MINLVWSLGGYRERIGKIENTRSWLKSHTGLACLTGPASSYIVDKAPQTLLHICCPYIHVGAHSVSADKKKIDILESLYQEKSIVQSLCL